MKYLSVCSGIEAATVAWHGLGWTPVAFSEIEAFPAAVLAHHYPTVPNLGDLTKYREWPEELLAEVDLLVGGTPCQAFSVAGKRQSLDDERGNLSLIYVNLYHHINEVRKRHGRPPAIALWENVPGVLSTKDNAFGCFIGGLLGCDEAPATESGKWDKAGFLSSQTVRVGYRVLDAQYFGVAQRRRRIFLAAVPCELVERLGERACPSEILSLRESVLGNPPTRGKAWEGVTGSITARFGRNGGGSNDDIDGKRLVAYGGNRTSGPLDVSTSLMSHGGPHGRQDFASETFVTHPIAFHPTQDPISSDGGSVHAIGTESSGGCATAAIAFSHSAASTSHGVACVYEGSPPICGGGAGNSMPAVAFTKAKRAQSSTDDETWVPGEVAPTQNQFDQGDARATTVVAFTQNSRDEVRQINGDGQIAGALGADAGMHQTSYIAFANRTRDGVKVPEVMKDGVVPALMNPGGGGRSDAVNVLAPGPAQVQQASAAESLATDLYDGAVDGDVAHSVRVGNGNAMGGVPSVMQPYVAFAQNQLGEVRTNSDVMGTVNTNQNASGRNAPMVQQAMQVRRLTPTECCRLQGFPDTHCDITFRKKPAADGPKYRALGNSMAVPCMWWLGYRIHKATSADKQ